MFVTKRTEATIPRPAWGWLYGIVTVMGGVLAVVEVAMPDGPARRVLECFVAAVMLGAMAIWVRVNRVPMALANEPIAVRPAGLARAPVRAASQHGR